MPTLHIEHAISDFAVWERAFARFAPAREKARVLAFRVRRPVDDPHYVLIDLDFTTVDEALRFREFLIRDVWLSRESSPALLGEPRAVVVEDAVCG